MPAVQEFDGAKREKGKGRGEIDGAKREKGKGRGKYVGAFFRNVCKHCLTLLVRCNRHRTTCPSTVCLHRLGRSFCF